MSKYNKYRDTDMNIYNYTYFSNIKVRFFFNVKILKKKSESEI